MSNADSKPIDWLCKECGGKGNDTELLTGMVLIMNETDDSFIGRAHCILPVCPKCKKVATTLVVDEEGAHEQAVTH